MRNLDTRLLGPLWAVAQPLAFLYFCQLLLVRCALVSRLNFQPSGVVDMANSSHVISVTGPMNYTTHSGFFTVGAVTVLRVPAVGSYLQYTTPLNGIVLGSGYSICMWMKMPFRLGQTWQSLTRGAVAAGSDHQAIVQESSGQIGFFDSVTYSWQPSGFNIVAHLGHGADWHHLAVVGDPSGAGQTKIYINGSLVGTANGLSTAGRTVQTLFANDAASPPNFAWLTDGNYDFRLYNTPLDTAGIGAVISEVAPTPSPTMAPTLAPTAAPTLAPTLLPTLAPSTAPTPAPTSAPGAPSRAPSASPTTTPTPPPTLHSTAAPTAFPTASPTAAPTSVSVTTTSPTASPAPSSSPTPEPPVSSAGFETTAVIVVAVVVLVGLLMLILYRLIRTRQKHEERMQGMELARPQSSQAAIPPAPTQWEEHTDRDGRPYYYNATTGESTYGRPAQV